MATTRLKTSSILQGFPESRSLLAGNTAYSGASWGSWTLTTLDAANNFPHIGYGNGLFMATEYNVPGSPAGNYGTGYVWSSANGTSWTKRTLPSVQQWKQAMYATSIGKWNIVCGGSGDFAYSTDGFTWTAGYNASLGNEWVTMASDTKFVAANYGSATGVYSTNGTSWTTNTMSGALTWAHGVYAPGPALFMAMTATTTYNTSPDGITWTSRTLPTVTTGYAIGTNGSVILVVDSSGTTNAVTSTDGINWTARTLPANGGQCIVYSPSAGQFIYVREGYTTGHTSPDGITWTAKTLPSDTFNSYRPSLAGSSIFVTGASGGKVATITYS